MASSRKQGSCAGSGQGRPPTPTTATGDSSSSPSDSELRARCEHRVRLALLRFKDYVPRGYFAGLQREVVGEVLGLVLDEVERAQQATFEWQRKP